MLPCDHLLLGFAAWDHPSAARSGLQGSLLGLRASLEGFATIVTGLIMSGYYLGFVAGSMVGADAGRAGRARTAVPGTRCPRLTTVLMNAVLVEPVT